MTTTLPTEVIAADAELSRASEKLAELRWHWTLDESNPDRVSMREYGRQVGRTHAAISASANGYAAHVAASGQGALSTRSLTDQVELARVGETRRVAAEAIADSEGTNVANVLRHRRAEVDAVIADATATAERRGTTVDDEIPAKAEWASRTRRARQKQAAAIRDSKSKSYAALESKLTRALTLLRGCVDDARYAGASGTDVEALQALVVDSQAALAFVDLALTGSSGVDWDAEAAKLGGSA